MRRVTRFKTEFSFEKRSKISGKDHLLVVVTHPYFKSGDDMIGVHAVKVCFFVDNEGNKD